MFVGCFSAICTAIWCLRDVIFILHDVCSETTPTKYTNNSIRYFHFLQQHRNTTNTQTKHFRITDTHRHTNIESSEDWDLEWKRQKCRISILHAQCVLSCTRSANQGLGQTNLYSQVVVHESRNCSLSESQRAHTHTSEDAFMDFILFSFDIEMLYIYVYCIPIIIRAFSVVFLLVRSLLNFSFLFMCASICWRTQLTSGTKLLVYHFYFASLYISIHTHTPTPHRESIYFSWFDFSVFKVTHRTTCEMNVCVNMHV